MLADPARGFLIEIMLTMVKRMQKKARVQVVAMSATVPNIGDLAAWLEAELYESDYRCDTTPYT